MNSFVAGDPARNGAVQNGIQIGFGATGAITNSRVADQITKSDRSGILIYGNDNQVTSNRIQDAPVGIWNPAGAGNSFPTMGVRRNTFVNVEEGLLVPAAARPHGGAAPVRISPAR